MWYLQVPLICTFDNRASNCEVVLGSWLWSLQNSNEHLCSRICDEDFSPVPFFFAENVFLTGSHSVYQKYVCYFFFIVNTWGQDNRYLNQRQPTSSMSYAVSRTMVEQVPTPYALNKHLTDIQWFIYRYVKKTLWPRNWVRDLGHLWAGTNDVVFNPKLIKFNDIFISLHKMCIRKNTFERVVWLS